MALIKTEEEISYLKASSNLVAQVLAEVAKVIKPGVTTLQLDKIAETYIRDHHSVPGFKGYNGYPNTLCTSVNSQVVHGIPSDYALREGDVLSVDCGAIMNGYYGDSAYTFAIGEIDQESKQLLNVTKECLFLGIQNAVAGKRIGDIGFAVQSYAESFNYSVVRELVGHGIGSNLHEPPEVPNFGRKSIGVKLSEGMVFCIEPMINMGSKNVIMEKDGWTIRTRDQKRSAHYELTVVVRKNQAEVLGTFDFIEEALNKK